MWARPHFRKHFGWTNFCSKIFVKRGRTGKWQSYLLYLKRQSNCLPFSNIDFCDPRSNIRTPYQFWKIRKDGSAVFLAIQLNIAQQQQLEIVTLLCYWRINLLIMKVLFIMLQMNHRNALRRRRRFRPYWVLPRPAESWFEIHFNRRIIVNWE